MRIALQAAENALSNKEFPVGCVIVKNSSIIARGQRNNSRENRETTPNELDHAEIIALRELSARLPHPERTNLTVYTTLEPCLMCFGALLINNVTTIVYAYEDAMGGGTSVYLPPLAPLYRRKNVSIIPHVCRQESLQLFKQFFTTAGSDYLQGTLLAEYTRDQE